jgi:hypothetical protein
LTARIARAVEKVDRLQRTLDPPANIVQLVEPGEALQVLLHGEALIEAWGLVFELATRIDT